jgi:hypothetical protein
LERRDLLRALGAATAFTIMPRTAQAAWERVAATAAAPGGRIVGAHAPLIAAIADAIIPRTDTPGALDVSVPAFVDVIVTEYYADDERAAFMTGLDAIEARISASGSTSPDAMTPAARTALFDSLDQPADHQAPDARAWSRLKGLVVHGYFTSERVQKEVLKTVVLPMRYDGDAPMKSAGAGHGAGHGASNDASHG